MVPGLEFDTARLALDTARQDLRREDELLRNLRQVRGMDVQLAQQRLAAARAKEAYARAALVQNRILAPEAGTVLDVHAYPGEAVPSDGLLDVGDLSRMFVVAEVYLSDLPRVQLGAPATITGDGFAGSISGKVVEVLREASQNQLYPTNVLTAADKRVIGVSIQLDDGSKVQHLSNSRVSMRIEP